MIEQSLPFKVKLNLNKLNKNNLFFDKLYNYEHTIDTGINVKYAENMSYIFKKKVNLIHYLPITHKNSVTKVLINTPDASCSKIFYNNFTLVRPFARNYLDHQIDDKIATLSNDFESESNFFSYNCYLDQKDYVNHLSNELVVDSYIGESRSNEVESDNSVLISGWLDLSLHNNLSSLTKTLLHVKYIKRINMFFFNDFLYFFSKLIDSKTLIKSKDNLEQNSINIFFKIKRSMHVIRILFMQYYGWTYETHRTYSKYFSLIKPYIPLDYVWFLEYNTMLFLIKIKLSNSMNYSNFLIHNNLIYNNSLLSLSKWSYINISSYTQFIICEWSYYKIIKFIDLLNKFIKNIVYFYKIRTINYYNQNTISNNYFRLKFLFFKYLECDYKILTFILLPLTDCRFYYNYVMLNWFNYWNHKIATWKYLT